MVRRGRPRVAARSSAIAQLPWRSVENPYGTLQVLDDDGLEAVHNASLRVLAELGVDEIGGRRALISHFEE